MSTHRSSGQAGGLPSADRDTTLAVARRIYDALVRDDIEAVLGVCKPDAEWRYPAGDRLRYGGSWRGLEAIGTFFEAHDQEEEILDFALGRMVADGDLVAVFGTFRGRARNTGRAWETSFVHAITVRDEQVERFEAYFDTAAAVEAHAA